MFFVCAKAIWWKNKISRINTEKEIKLSFFFFFFAELKVKVRVTQSCPTLCNPMNYGFPYSPWNFQGENTVVCSLSLLQGIFLTQGLNPGLPHCRWILCQLSHKRNPRILEWVDYPFSSRSSWPRNRTRVSYIAGRFFINWAIMEALRSLFRENPKFQVETKISKY